MSLAVVERQIAFQLGDHEIHLWSSSVRQPEVLQKDLRRTLSPDEWKKAARFRFDEQRNAYIVAHGLLRLILSCYAEVEPERLEFVHGPRGKPALRGVPIHFNMSHSKDVVVYAVAEEPKLGIDVEYIRSIPDVLAIARQFFSPVEYQDLLTLEEAQRSQGFFSCWTRKEAYIKAIGDGLYTPLDQFQVAVKPKQPVALVSIQEDQRSASEWSLFDWKLSQRYACAVAICGSGWHITHFRFSRTTDPMASCVDDADAGWTDVVDSWCSGTWGA